MTSLYSDMDNHLIRFPDGATAVQCKSGSVWGRLQIQAGDDIMIYKSADGGQSWPTIRTILTSADIELLGLSGMQCFIDTSSNTVGLRWLFGANKKYGYALNINISNGDMQFYYLQDGHWVPSWKK